jgi:hypothetical protein
MPEFKESNFYDKQDERARADALKGFTTEDLQYEIDRRDFTDKPILEQLEEHLYAMLEDGILVRGMDSSVTHPDGSASPSMSLYFQTLEGTVCIKFTSPDSYRVERNCDVVFLGEDGEHAALAALYEIVKLLTVRHS